MPEHGKRGTYVNSGCRCEACFLADQQYRSNYRLLNSSRINARISQWRKDNPDYEKDRYAADEFYRLKKTAGKARRKARKLLADHGCVNAGSIETLLNTIGRLCVYCGSEYAEIDHVDALSRGGAHCVGNLLPACKSCNSAKGAKSIMAWRDYFGKPFFADIDERITCDA